MDVAVEKSGNVFVRRRNLVFLQDAGDDAGIGHARNFDVVQIVCNLEPLRQRQFERVDACAARMDEGTVDVEKEETLLLFRHVERFVFRLSEVEWIERHVFIKLRPCHFEYRDLDRHFASTRKPARAPVHAHRRKRDR